MGRMREMTQQQETEATLLPILSILLPPSRLFCYSNHCFQSSRSPTLLTPVVHPILEDSVCGSAHCALAHYWSLKMNKCDFVAYTASRRSGTLKVHYDKEKQRVLLTGKAVTVMRGSILV